MRRRSLFALAAMWIVSIVSIGAEPVPNLAGKWTFVSGWSLSMSGSGRTPVKADVTEPTGPLGTGGSITQDDKLFAITPAATEAQKTVCDLSGHTGPGLGKSAGRCLALVGKDVITLMGIQRVDAKMTASMTRFSLDAEGRLVVVVSGPSEFGHPGPIATLIYRRSTGALGL